MLDKQLNLQKLDDKAHEQDRSQSLPRAFAIFKMADGGDDPRVFAAVSQF